MITKLTPKDYALDKEAIRVVVGFDSEKQVELVQFVKMTPVQMAKVITGECAKFDYDTMQEWVESVIEDGTGVASPVVYENKTQETAS
jgi:hypothetical protein